MAKMNLRAAAAALLVALSVPALSQAGFSEGYQFLKAIREKDGQTVDAITSSPSSTAINYRDPGTGEGALHILTRARELSWLGFLLGRGARPDIQNNEGDTPLIIAAQIGWREGAERLLAARADVNRANNRGETPLIMAVQRLDAPMVRLLMSQGADPNLTDNVAGSSALDYARQDSRSAAVLRAIEDARQTGPARRAAGPVDPRQR